MRFLLTCGGTAGHINPALAVAERLAAAVPGAEFLFVGAEGRMETDLVPRAGYRIETVPITNLRRGLSPADLKHNLATLRNVGLSIAEAKKLIRDFAPDAALGTGGYVCYPVLRAAAALGVPTAVHESNVRPGLTTKMLEGVVDAVLVGFAESRGNYRRPARVQVTGTPVRAACLRADGAAARRTLGVPEGRPLVVSVWGSNGAAHMNEIMADFIVRAAGDPFFSLVHSTGKAGYARMCETLARAWPGYREAGMDVRDYVYDMPEVMAAADLVLCRAGASTLAELTAMGKPAVLVPSPNVTNNHQEANARALEAAGGACVLPEAELTADGLLGLVSGLLASPGRLAEMAAGMRRLAVPDAVDRIAETVLALAMERA